MRVLISSPVPEIAMAISVAASLADIESEIEPSLQAFGSLLFRTPDAVGVFWAAGPASAAESCRRLRLADVRNALLVVLDTNGDVVRCAMARAVVLNAGADDAQHWPIDGDELVARLRALHRREIDTAASRVAMAGAVFYPARSSVEGPNGVVHLSGQETKLLEALVSRRGIYVSRAVCMLALYQQRDEAQVKIIDVFVCKLRRKLLPVTGGLDVIQTVWGRGYLFRPEGYAPVMTDSRRRMAG